MSSESERTLDELELLDIRNDTADTLGLVPDDDEECDVLLEALNEAYVMGELRGAKQSQEIFERASRSEISIPILTALVFMTVTFASAIGQGNLLSAFICLAGVCALLVKRYFSDA